MAAGGVGQDFQGGKLAAGLHGAESLFAGRSLVPQLDDVHSAGQRGVGEFGSVVFISGNLPMKTEILPLVIIGKLDQYAVPAATAIAVLMLGFSFVMLLGINLLQRWAQRRAVA